MILVAGATGFLGGEICRRLVAHEHAVRAMVRPSSDAARVEHLRSLGAALVEADLKDPSSLQDAVGGVDVVITTVSTTLSRQPGDTIEAVDGAGQLALVEAARRAGVRHFIYISYPELDDADPCPLTVAKRSVERAIMASAMAYTILRPTFFMEVWLGPALGFDLAGGNVLIYGSGENRVSWISLGDVAEFAAQSVTNPAALNATLTLGGPEALSYRDVVRLAESVGGRPIAVQTVPEEALRAQQAAATDSLSKSFASLMLSVTQEQPIEMAGVLARFPIALTIVRSHVQRSVGSPVAV